MPFASLINTTPEAWARNEFGHAELGDARRRRRLLQMATEFARQSNGLIPQSAPNWAAAKASYRFLDNDAIEDQAIARAHQHATGQRINEQRPAIVLALQDTTFLDYSGRPHTKGLGDTGSQPGQSQGLLLHSTLAVSAADGLPLGLLDHAVSARDPEHFGRAKKRKQRPTTEKESGKWLASLNATQVAQEQCPHSRFVNVADREGDLYDALAAAAAGTVDLLVRSRHNRKLSASKKLWDRVESRPVRGHHWVEVPARGGRRARRARLSLRYERVEIPAPASSGSTGSIHVWAISAREGRPPKGCAPLHWRLLSTVPVEELAAAAEQVGWYARRWQIEELHKVLKSGCRVEARQLESAARLKRALAIDLVVAWRILALTKLGRITPQASVAGWLDRSQWKALSRYARPGSKTPRQAPRVEEAVQWLGSLGGHLGRTKDGPPGAMTLWRGMARLTDLELMWRLCHEE